MVGRSESRLAFLTDLLFASTVVVPGALTVWGRIELAILALVFLLIASGLTASQLPDAPFRQTEGLPSTADDETRYPAEQPPRPRL